MKIWRVGKMGKVYIKKIIDKNVGPLKDIQIVFPFHESGNPKPVILVGENGTGKTSVLSNIVDAFFEMAGKAYTNVNISSTRNGYQYFKTISPSEIHNEESFMYSYISFIADNNPEYIFKSGEIPSSELKGRLGNTKLSISWGKKENKKENTSDEKTALNIWENNVLCYFGPDRYEKPVWMGSEYYKSKYYKVEELLHPSVKNNWHGILKNPIIVQDVISPNLQWLLDVIADSRADIVSDGVKLRLDRTDVSHLLTLREARNNLETILSKVLGIDVYFQLNYRNSGGSRFRIVRKSDNSVVCPTFDSLSTGQIALFNLFATIVRYADNNNIMQSIKLSDITGIVVIDEIELHLHSKMQKEILPQLLRLFPGIQFVITSHAPLFLLGMKESFGDDGFEIYEMPNALKIDAERFSEFLRAYEYIKSTDEYQKSFESIASTISSGKLPLIITEGSTDWKHIKTALGVLRSKEEYKELFNDLDFELLEYEPSNSKKVNCLKIEMGNSALVSLCENVAKLPYERKIIIIADRDTECINRKLTSSGKSFKSWGNSVYSTLLPIPKFREDTPGICIEHYYSDVELEKEIEINGIKRRLYMGKDFNGWGYSNTLDRICERKDVCGPGKINIIDGSQGERVKKLSDDKDDNNYAVSKSDFVEYVETHTDEFDFSNFIPLFELIKTIICDGTADR